MGLLVDGKWVDQWYDTSKTKGKFKRKPSQFRNWITSDGASGFKAEPGRYHLYVSLACPWAHRALIFRKLKGLEDMISLSVVHYLMLDQGWTFEPGKGVIPDPIHRARYMHEVYTKADPHYTGRVTVPVVWDKKNGTIVNNESSEVIRMFNSAFDEVGAAPGDFYPEALRDQINEVNDMVYTTVNNGVYKCGFATTQEAYDEAYDVLFKALDELEKRLKDHPYLVGEQITEADWRLFTTLIRFDAVYYSHFKCNKKHIMDYPNLSRHLKELYDVPGISETVNLVHIKNHYYKSHRTINPTGIVPLGPEIPWS